MTAALLYGVSGVLVALVTGLANTSARRLVVAGGVGLLVAFFAFPISLAVGFLSREALQPTPLGLLPAFPALALLALGAVAALAGASRGGRLGGGLALVGGVMGWTALVAWMMQPPMIVVLAPLDGLVEGAAALATFAVLALVSTVRPRLRWPLLTLGLLLAAGVFLWLGSPAGQRVFPKAEGYYTLLRPTPAGTAERIVASYNAELETLNAQRESIGLAALEPLASLGRLVGQRLPRTAAEEGYRLLQPASRGYGSGVVFLFSGLLAGAGGMLLWRPRLERPGDPMSGVVLALVVSALAPAFAATNFSLHRLAEGWPFLLDFLDRAWPPEPRALQEVASQMLITVEIALVGTFLAALVAVPLSFLAARNLTGGSPWMRTVFTLTRTFFNVDRGVDTLILALVFVAAVGLGPFAGVLAMAIHSIADLGKVYSESIENVNRGPIEALEAVGASGTNVVRWAILPQVTPLLVGWTLYRFEINFRVSIVLGLVGAGGIGFFIQEKMGTGAYAQMVVAVLAIVLVVNIIDFASSWLRGRLV